MTDRETEYLGVDVASVATILVDGLDRETVTRFLASRGLEFEENEGLLFTRFQREREGTDPVTILVDFDLADGVVHVHSEDHRDAYDLAPVATTILEAIGGVESQSLFTYSLSFDHPLVSFETLLDRLDGDGISYERPADPAHDPTADDGAAEPMGVEDHGEMAADDAVGGDGLPVEDVTGGDGERTPPSARDGPTGPRRPHLSIQHDGGTFELYDDGYLIPIDDASRESVAGLVAHLNARLRASYPEPPGPLSVAELPDCWAGPVVERHPAVGVVPASWPAVVDDPDPTAEVARLDPGAIREHAGTEPAAFAEMALDVLSALSFALDHLSSGSRGLYYDRYVEAGDPFLGAIPLGDAAAERERFLSAPLWSPARRRVAAATRMAIRDLADAFGSYEGRDLAPGQVWTHHAIDRHVVGTVELVGREAVGEALVSLPVWVGEVRDESPCDHGAAPGGAEGDRAAVSTGDGASDAGLEVVPIRGDYLVERVDDAPSRTGDRQS